MISEHNDSAHHTEEPPGKPPAAHEFNIQIDRQHYKVTQSHMTGLQLRQVPSPPIGSDRDLFEVIPGGTDEKVADDQVVEIKDGKRFFTAPTQINPGSE
jgi:hypothetical protein